MAFYDQQKLINFLKKYNGYVEKRKNTPKKNLYEMTGNYVGSDNWTMFWQDLADVGLANYQGSYYCIATIFWGFVKVYGLAVAQELCLQKFMINCQETYNLFKRKGRVYSSPQVGDIIVFWSGSRFHHAEFVTKVTSTSYNGRWFDGGYAKPGYEKTKHGERYRDYYQEAKANLLAQVPNLQKIVFTAYDYKRIVPVNCLIYSDPPYANTKQYANATTFDYDDFWDTMRTWSRTNIVLISEQHAPDDFKCIWEQEVSRSIKAADKSKSVEKLFIYNKE